MARYYALIPAAGTGSRFGAATPKQYARIDGKAVLQHAIERLALGLPLQRIYVALSPDDGWFDREIAPRDDVTVLRCGGAMRAQTVANALTALQGVDDEDWIAVHDAVRPCIDADSLRRLQRELADDPIGGLLAVPVAATLKRGDAQGRSVRTEPREGLWLAQTPQMFRYRVLRDAFSRNGFEQSTDEAQAVESLGAHPRLVMGNAANLKITYPDDLRLAGLILATLAQER
ncbi:MAG TPA: 2-C-methyl-D-erythritol 4-phosphate cytidylyltransferase [Casimicrobiaceae bacterium]|nr:2-C-methyl-D-erythritol 4-phosphate cytidylyltransferase [Casimicrobiaceae bacterium]